MHKRQLPIVLAFLAGAIPVLSSLFTTPQNFLQVQMTDRLEQWMIIVAAFALPLGVVSVFQVNLRKIEKRDAGWPFALALLLSLVATAIVGINDALDGLWGVRSWRVLGAETAFEWVQRAFFKPLQATMFSLLAFYLASAAFRAFRVRNVDATILLSAAMIVMLGVNPYGIKLFSWVPALGGAVPGGDAFMPWLTNWLMTIPNAAAQRGIIIGAALGAASMSLRVLLGIERSYLGLRKGE
jgi:hypothetical protein